MSKLTFEILASGSKGNAVVLDNMVLIDCGVPFKAIKPYASRLKLVLLTHIHGDHLNLATIRTLAVMRPTLRFGCCSWLVSSLLECGVSPFNIDVFTVGSGSCYSDLDLTVYPVALRHNVPNCGYRLYMKTGKVLYATDTNTLEQVSAPGYDLYLVEANYTDEEIARRIAEKEAAGEYCYEHSVLENHLSKAKCDEWLMKNMRDHSQVVYMHKHSADLETL